MDRFEVEKLEENVKGYDSEYEPKKVTPGSVIDIIVENNDIVKSQVIYIRKEFENDSPNGMENISYDLAEKYFLGCYKDETINIESAKVTIAEIYETIDEYDNRNINKNAINTGSVIDTTHNGIHMVYHIAETSNQLARQKGITDIYKTTPLSLSLLGKQKGDVVNFDIHLNPNTVVINEVYKDIKEYNKEKGISIIRPGSVVDITIDGLPFVFNCVVNATDIDTDDKLLDVINMDIPLGRELLGKTSGDKFTYEHNGQKLDGYINQVYDDIEDYINCSLDNKKQKTL